MCFLLLFDDVTDAVTAITRRRVHSNGGTARGRYSDASVGSMDATDTFDFGVNMDASVPLYSEAPDSVDGVPGRRAL